LLIKNWHDGAVAFADDVRGSRSRPAPLTRKIDVASRRGMIVWGFKTRSWG
jgi:hypothetical protein